MKLSEAMRTGASLAPKGEGQLVDSKGATCAIGAAYHGATGMLPNIDWWTTDAYPAIEAATGVRFDTEGRHPKTRKVNELGDIIWDLNDTHGWTRERIAAWLEKQGY